MGKLPEAKQAGGGIIRQPVPGGLYVSSVNGASAPAAARHRLRRKGPPRLPRRRPPGAPGGHVAAGGWGRRRQRKGKEKAPDLFAIFPHIKLFLCPLIMLRCRCCLCLSQTVNYLPSKDYEERLHGASKGSAPRSPSSVLLKKEESFPLESCWHLT